MAKESRQKEFLAKAKEADERAEKMDDPGDRLLWQKIAQGYRDLAKTT